MNKILAKKRMIIILILLLVVLIGGSYAWLQVTLHGNSTNTIQVGTLSLALGETSSEGIHLQNAIPISDEKGLETEAYTFTLTNNGDITSEYTVYLDDVELEDGQDRIPDTAVKYSLTKNEVVRDPALISTLGQNANRILDSGKLAPGEKNEYTLKIWIDYDADNSIMGKVFSTKIRVEATQEGITSQGGSGNDNNPTIDLDVNSKDQKIDLNGEDAHKFIFASSDAEIVEVDENGNLIQKGPGQAVITITNKETGDIKKITVSVTKTLTVTYEKTQGISFIEKETDSCKLTAKGQKSCSVSLPNITADDGYEVIGWNTDVNALDGQKAGEKVDISADTTYYAISSKNPTKFVATFNANGVGVKEIAKTELSCRVNSDGEESCEITLPKFTVNDGYEAIGWSMNENDTTGIRAGEKVKLTKNTTFYAITKTKVYKYEVTFYKNGALSQTNEAGERVEDNTVTRSCSTEEIYNNKEKSDEIPSCEITSPIIEGSVNTPTVLGYGTSKDAKETVLDSNHTIKVSKNAKYYAITRKDEVVRTAIFIKNGVGVESIGGKTKNIRKECVIEPTYNGEIQKTSCTVENPPSIEVKQGYSEVGWNIDPTQKTAITPIILEEDAAFYSISKKDAVVLTARFHKNGAVAQDGSTEEIYEKTCDLEEVYNKEIQKTSCNVVLPEITASENTPTPVGYVEVVTSIVPIKEKEVTLTADKDYYAITKKEAEQVSVTYKLNNARYFVFDDGTRYTKDTTTTICNKQESWNGKKQEDCQFTLPTIKGSANTPKVLGWSTAQDDHEVIYQAGQKDLISKSTVLYAQTTKDAITYKVKSYNVGKNVASIDASTAKKSCSIDATYNGESQATECVIKSRDLPVINAKTGYEVAGWSSIDSNSLEGSVEITLNKDNHNKAWYAYAIGHSFKIEYYSDGVKNSEETLSITDHIALKQIQKDGYTLKGWDTNPAATTVVYPKEGPLSDIVPTKGQVIQLYAVWQDNIAPECSFSNPSVITTGNTTEMKLTCSDVGSGLTEKVLTKDNFTISNSTYGEISSVGNPIPIENGYEYLITLKGLSSSTEGGATENIPGRFNIELKENSIIDQSGNGNKTISSSYIEVYGHRYTATFTKDSNAIDSIGATSASCITKGASLTCDVVTPSITAKEGYQVVGWGVADSGEDTTITPPAPVTLSSDVTYYTIYQYLGQKLKAVFHLNGAKTLDGGASDITRECVVEANSDTSQASSCNIVVPIIEASANTPTVLGFATKANETNEGNMINQANQSIVIPIVKNTDYYAITKKDAITYHVNYVQSGIGVTSIEKQKDSCEIEASYNGGVQKTSCNVDAPKIAVKSGYTSIGWNTDATAKISLVNTDELNTEKLNITSDNAKYYSISKKDKVTLKATFDKNGSDSIGENGQASVEETCDLEEAYNNEEQATECEINTIPQIVAGTNTPKILGYSTNKDSIIGEINPETETETKIKISNNIKYYAITTNDAKNIKVTFYKNGATSLNNSSDDSVDDLVEQTCTISQTYNGKEQGKSCSITSPTIQASSNTPSVIGFSTSTDRHENDWAVNTSKEVSENANYYAQTKKDAVTYRISKFAKGTHVSSLSTTDGVSCEIVATYNGDTQETRCTIDEENLPEITPEVGYKKAGWNQNKNNAESAVSVITLTDNVDTYYAHALANSYTVKYYDGEEEKASNSAKVGEDINLVSATTLGLTKEGYNFKGWTKTSGSTVVEYQDGAQVSNLATEEGAIVPLYAVWQDDIAPVCQFTNEGTIYTGDTKELTLTCTETGSGLENPNLTVDNFRLSNGYGQVVSVSAPEEVSGSYQYKVVVQGLASGSENETSGTFQTILNAESLVDNALNKVEETTSSDITVEGITYTANFVSQGRGVGDLSTTRDSCTTTGSNTSCEITLPEIPVVDEDSYTVVGWNTDKDAETGVSPGSYELNSENTTQEKNQTYYTITYKNAISYSVTWNANGASISEEQSSCTIDRVYNESEEKKQATSCTVKIPKITRDGYTIIGYNTSADEQTAILPNGDSSGDSSGATLELYSDQGPYYAITSKDFEITWTKDNDQTVIGSTMSSCTIYNEQTECEIVVPTITNDIRVVEGWYDSSDNKFADAPDPPDPLNPETEMKKMVSASATYTARTRMYYANEVSYSNSESSCTNAQCAIDDITEKLK